MNLGWAIGFFFYFAPASLIQWGTVFSLFRMVKILSTAPLTEMNNSALSPMRGIMMNNMKDYSRPY